MACQIRGRNLVFAKKRDERVKEGQYEFSRGEKLEIGRYLTEIRKLKELISANYWLENLIKSELSLHIFTVHTGKGDKLQLTENLLAMYS